MKLKKGFFHWEKVGKCPGCGVCNIEFINTDRNGILVNVETRGRFRIPNFWIPSRKCRNPLCEWSKINISDLNLCNIEDAWEIIDDE